MSIDLNYFSRDVIKRDSEDKNQVLDLTREEGMIFQKSTQDSVMLIKKINDERKRAESSEEWLESYADNGIRLASYAWNAKASESVAIDGKIPDLVTCKYDDKYYDIAIPFLPMGGTIFIPVVVDKRVGFIIYIHIEPTECTVTAYAREDDALFDENMSISQQVPPWERIYQSLDARVTALESRI